MSQNDVFLILHGTGGNASGHWQEYLAEGLRAAREDVRYPRLPLANAPRLRNWMPALERELAAIGAEDRLTVVAHSRSCILWLHHAAAHAKTRPSTIADRVLLVAPPYRAEEPRGPRPFFPAPLSREGVGNTARRAAVIASDDDEYATLDEAEHCATALSIPLFKLPSSGHISPASGYGNWPWILNWCLGMAEFPPEPKNLDVQD